jgi:hypothetical protein
MQTISDFLKKFSQLKPTARVVKEVVLDILKNKNIPITVDEIIYSNNVVYIKSNQIVKNEIFISKESILKEIENKLNKKTVKDIR